MPPPPVVGGLKTPPKSQRVKPDFELHSSDNFEAARFHAKVLKQSITKHENLYMTPEVLSAMKTNIRESDSDCKVLNRVHQGV